MLKTRPKSQEFHEGEMGNAELVERLERQFASPAARDVGSIMKEVVELVYCC